MVLVVWRNATTAGYYDDGTVFSSALVSEIEVVIMLEDPDFTVTEGDLTLRYLNFSYPEYPEGLLVENNEDIEFIRGGDEIYFKGVVTVEGAIKLNEYTISLNGGNAWTVTKTIDKNVSAGQKLSLFENHRASIHNFQDDNALSYSISSNIVFESTPLGDEGLIQKSGTVYTYNYLLKDHLGSTRMVLDENGDIKQALMYQPYGAVSDAGLTVNPIPDPLRQKFTGKEFDQDGSGVVDNRCSITFDIVIYDYYDAVTNEYLLVFYEDGTTEQITFDKEGLKLYIKETIDYTSNKVIDKIFIRAGSNNLNYSHSITQSERDIPLGMAVTVSAYSDYNIVYNYSNVPDGASGKPNIYTISEQKDYFSGIQLYYFGDRYYDPEIGRWTAVDPGEQFIDSYRYTRNPISFFDPDGWADKFVAMYYNAVAQNGKNVALDANKYAANFQAELAAKYPDDNVQVKAFETGDIKGITDFLNQGSAQDAKNVLISHSNVGKTHISDVPYLKDGTGDHLITFVALEMALDVDVGMAACGAGTTLKDNEGNLKAIPGTEKSGSNVTQATRDYLETK